MNDETPYGLGAPRVEYQRSKLNRTDLHADPIVQCDRWIQEAADAGLPEANCMALATVDVSGCPLQRAVLCKRLDARGFVFFTNMQSRKAQHIARHAQVSLLFLWLPLERQIIVTGEAFRLSSSDVLRYFLTRPRESQISAWASQQSSVISSRAFLEAEWERLKARFAARQIPLPSFWGGYCVQPRTVELWQGRPNRLHDRFEYTRAADGGWLVNRLAP